jgi:hypothetical protein
MCVLKILSHPLNKVILENALDQLVEEIDCDQLKYVGPREV